MAERTHDSPRLEKRVRMRVVVKPHRTSLPLAHDETFTNNGSNTVRQGTAEIVVYASDVPKVLARVEDDLATLASAHNAFWREAVRAVMEKLRSGGIHNVAIHQLTTPAVGGAVNRWVEANWPDVAQQAYFTWLTRECDDARRNPQAIFRAMTGRSERPLESAEVIEENIPEPLTDEQRQHTAVTETIVRAVTGGGGHGGIDEERLAAAIVKSLAAAGVLRGPRPDRQ